jgi:hypothetical protein
MTRPACYNRPPRAPGAWARNGVDPRTLKPRLRWVPAWSPDRCAVHDGHGIGPMGEGYAEANGWDCGGCRWESGKGDDWAIPPIRMCEACFGVHDASFESCRLCGAALPQPSGVEQCAPPPPPDRSVRGDLDTCPRCGKHTPFSMMCWCFLTAALARWRAR